MFGSLKKIFGGEKKERVIYAPLEGDVIPITEVSDPAFSQEILGKGIAIKPSKGQVVSPVNGTVSMMFDTGHAVSLVSEDGLEILVHVGMDTVQLKGQFYTIHKQNDDPVKVGDLLIEFDMEGIKNAGYEIVTPVVICNSDEFPEVRMISGVEGTHVTQGTPVMSF